MASIRRTLSPAYHNKPIKTAKKTPHSLFRCFAFFMLGILIGFTPQNHAVNHLNQVNQLNITVDHSKEHRFFDRLDRLSVTNIEKSRKDDVVDGFSVNAVSNGIEKSREDGFSVNAVRLAERRKDDKLDTGKLVIVVTPTFNRAMQGYFLSRLGQVLRLVPWPVLWIVVEENSASFETAEVLRRTGVMYRHLVCELKANVAVKDRGVHQRNVALEHIELHRLDGIVYFADDDNVYSVELFDRLRDIRRFGTWPVAMLTQSKNKAVLEGPVCNGSQVIGWHTNEKSKRLRRFHVDMSGFAFNSTILWDPKRWKRPTKKPIRQLDTVKEGFQETTFIEQIVEDESQMECIPRGCSKIMNWHLHLEARNLVYPKGWLLQKNLNATVPVK